MSTKSTLQILSHLVFIRLLEVSGCFYRELFLWSYAIDKEVDNWEDLKGTYVRAEFKDSMIKRIGHLIKDQWFDYEKYVETVKAKNMEEVE